MIQFRACVTKAMWKKSSKSYLRMFLKVMVVLVTFISFISYTKVHLFISCTKVQLIHFHLIHFTDHSPSHSHSPYLVLLILHRISTSLSLSFLNQSHLWKLGVSLDKILFRNVYCIILKLNSDGITALCYFIKIATSVD